MQSLWNQADRLGIREMIDYYGFLPSRKEWVQLRHRASIGLVLNLPVPNYLTSIPNKLGELMAYGLPVVLSHFPNYQEVAGVSGAGIAVDPTQPEQIANAITRAYLQSICGAGL